jgi:hypothetical protein
MNKEEISQFNSNNYLEDYLEQETILSHLQEYPEDLQEEILNALDPNNFEEMIYVSDFYLGKGKFRNQFLDKISQITTWKTFLDQKPPLDFLMVFLKDLKIDLTDLDLIIYYLTHYKVPLPLFKTFFQKIYDFVLLENQNDRIKLRKQSTIYDGIFALQTNYELIEIFDFLIRNIEETNNGLNSSFSDVLMILLEFIKMKEDITIPENRLNRLNNLIKE